MAMRINQAGEQRSPLAIEFPVGLSHFVAALEQLADFAVGRDRQTVEADDLARRVECDAVDVVNPAIGEGGGCEEEGG